MPERVVYFLGAGFSHAFGLPLISNFIETARDLDQVKRRGPHFDMLLRDFNARFSRIKNVYQADLENIEEVLSLAEIDVVLGKADSDPIKKFVVEVIRESTPKFPVSPKDLYTENWRHEFLPPVSHLDLLALFVAAMQNLSFSTTEISSDLGPKAAPERHRVAASPSANAKYHYDIVTTNYDRLLEDACEWLAARFAGGTVPGFRLSDKDDPQLPALAKLHGCVRNGEIVPPTWNKAADRNIMPRWRLAREVLGNANHIRFVGYSLPESDAYVRYLLKSASLDAFNLKSISVICWEPTALGTAEHETAHGRYARFLHAPGKVKYSGHRFEDVLTTAALAFRGSNLHPSPSECLESAHGESMSGHRR